MKDKFGNELTVGDEIYFATHHGANSYAIRKAVIYGFTKTMVKIKDIDDGVIVYGEKTIYPDKIRKVFSK